jgi:predicted nucleotidyltransferase
MKFGLPDRVIARLVEVLSQNESIERTVLFGSRAKGTYHEGSDIDLCLTGTDINLSVLSRLEARIDDLDMPWKVDLVPEAMIDSKALLDHIHRVGAVLYERTLTA